MSLLVDLQLVPNRILEVVKARILANRARMGAGPAKVKGPTRPRVQRQRFNASATAYRRPEPSAQDNLLDYCYWVMRDWRSGGAGQPTTTDYVSDNYYKVVSGSGLGYPTASQVADKGWTLTRAGSSNRSPILKAEATILNSIPEYNYDFTGSLYQVDAYIGFSKNPRPLYVRLRFAAADASTPYYAGPFVFNIGGVNLLYSDPSDYTGSPAAGYGSYTFINQNGLPQTILYHLYGSLGFSVNQNLLPFIAPATLVSSGSSTFTFLIPKDYTQVFFIRYNAAAYYAINNSSNPLYFAGRTNYMKASVEVAISPTLAGLAF